MLRSVKSVVTVFSFVLISCGNSVANYDAGTESITDSDITPDSAIQYTCPDAFIQTDGGACCPESLPQQCGDNCVPADCRCVPEYNICVPEDFEYCGSGIACPSGESCVADGDTFVCVPLGQTYCGSGVICDTATEECASDDSGTYCIPLGWEHCGEGRSCGPGEHCAGSIIGCCRDEQFACGESLCCFEGEECSEDCADCVPRHGSCCNGEVCPAGYCCPDDGLSLCVPCTADYCGGGRFCLPGVCMEDGGCCPIGLSQRCGGICCPDGYECQDSPWGEVCLPRGVTPCGVGSYCDPDEFCADEGLCLPVGADICPGGHWCPPGLNCSGPTCCREYAPVTCGRLCCPSGWECIGGGLDCIPPGAEFCPETGIWCGPDSHCSETSGRCITIGWEECGSGPACSPDQVCATEGSDEQCCPADQPVLCGSICCGAGFQCIHASDGDLCIPSGATYCEDESEQEWCPAGTRCGRLVCVPVWLDECADGSYCASGYSCTESNPPCCPFGTEALTFRGEPDCYPLGTDICHSTMGEDLSLPGTYCAPDGVCPASPPGSAYCGGCQSCSGGTSCQGLCSSRCCEETGCLRGCQSDEGLCYDQPTSNASNAYLTAREGSLRPDHVPHEVSGWAEAGDIFTDIIGIFGGDVDFNFRPAGFDECYRNGVYRVECDPDTSNWVNRRSSDIVDPPLERGNEILVTEAFWVIDNLEGIYFPHGPYAQLQAIVYPASHFPDPEHVTPSQAHNVRPGNQRDLKGPLTGDCTWEYCVCWFALFGYCFSESCFCGEYFGGTDAEQEWVANTFMRYQSGWAGLYRWREDETAIRFAVMESDPGYSDYREDDYMGFALIDREATRVRCGLWVPLYKYEPEGGEAYPEHYYRTDRIAGFILLRTITCTGRASDPC